MELIFKGQPFFVILVTLENGTTIYLKKNVILNCRATGQYELPSGLEIEFDFVKEPVDADMYEFRWQAETDLKAIETLLSSFSQNYTFRVVMISPEYTILP